MIMSVRNPSLRRMTSSHLTEGGRSGGASASWGADFLVIRHGILPRLSPPRLSRSRRGRCGEQRLRPGPCSWTGCCKSNFDLAAGTGADYYQIRQRNERNQSPARGCGRLWAIEGTGGVTLCTQERTPVWPVGVTASARKRFLPLAVATSDQALSPGSPLTSRQLIRRGMAEIAAHATEQGTVLLTVTSDAGQRGQAELSADQAEDLKAQLETALLAVRTRQIEAAIASLPQTAPHARRVLDRQPPTPKRGRLSRFFRRA